MRKRKSSPPFPLPGKEFIVKRKRKGILPQIGKEFLFKPVAWKKINPLSLAVIPGKDKRSPAFRDEPKEESYLTRPLNILLVYPEYPDTFWSFKYALKFVSKKAAYPPLGLLTMASLLPSSWNKRLVDMNVHPLRERDLVWADYIFISAMVVQQKSVREVISRARRRGIPLVAGGPLFTASYHDYPEIDHFVLNEAEITLPLFLQDFQQGQPRRVYQKKLFPSLQLTPPPLWNLIQFKDYLSMNLQFSRGCPFDCEFCDITALFGRKVRVKSADQVINELEMLYQLGWRGNIFFVDDNFIGNKKVLKKEVLPAMIDWMVKRKHPFSFNTEASINLSDDDELMSLMIQAGFVSVFVGIESPDLNSLQECHKVQNLKRDLLDSVRKLQQAGLEVTGGFIVGFDSDSPDIFSQQIEFIQKSKIITAMVGLLNAPRNTRLYRRLKKEGRLLPQLSGNNTDFTMNFIPKMDYETLINGYRQLIEGIYSYKPYYQRVKNYLAERTSVIRRPFRLRLYHLQALARSMFLLGIKDRGRFYYWKLFFWSLIRQPTKFPQAIIFSIYGYHFRKVLRLQ
ncbi:DUF4070 domain-containing protein [Candidatus Aminicenantes bacterium AC-334-K16]|jgi:radical SAM superfamily enzyme YgiQ (UPF0313 family)|nr:DUF4070 domain-containing protein [Candidatus Aminicenantes bacterium AC-334-K16]